MSMEDGKLYVIITDKTGDDGGGDGSPDENESEKEKSNPLADYAKHQLMHLVKSTTTKAVNFGISQIGNLTGDYALQNQVENVKNTINAVVSLGMSAYAGFKVGGPIGAAIGAGVSIASQVVDYGISVITQNINTMKQNYQIDMLRIRAGLDGSTNGSRTGN